MKAQTDNGQRWRYHLLWIGLVVLALALVWRIVQLQVLDTDRGYRFLQAEGNARSLRTEVVDAHRGMITDRNGQPLAVSTPVLSLWCDPSVLAKHPDKISQLASALRIRSGTLARRVGKDAGARFMYLQRNMAPAKAQAIMALDVPGLYARKEYKRYYPAGEVTAQLLGFTNIDDRGQEGLELAYDKYLRGEPGAKQVLKDLHGHIIQQIREIKPASPGHDLQLSIDLRLQYLAYRALKKAVTKSGSRSGSIVLLDAHTGEVLALANQPSFNPNSRGDLDPRAIRNRAIIDAVEPGSTVKPFTMVAALETGRYTPATVIDTSPGYLRVNGKTLLDPVNYGMIDLATVLKKSSQIGTSKIALTLDPNHIRDVFYRVGLGQVTGTGFPGESVGLLPTHRRWRDIERASFAFGYGLTVTPLQLAQAYLVLADGGIRKSVSLLKLDKPEVGQRVIDPVIDREILSMLSAVTQAGGTAADASIPAYSIAGKTGTVEKVGAHGYTSERHMALFAGIAPARDPAIVGVVVVNEPATDKYFGGELAAPIFSEVAETALRLLDVPPDKPGDFLTKPILASRS